MGNVIINKNNVPLHKPFFHKKLCSPDGCTEAAVSETSIDGNSVVKDTIGFTDNKFDYQCLLPYFRKKLNEVHNQVDCVIFVLQMGRINESPKKYLAGKIN